TQWRVTTSRWLASWGSGSTSSARTAWCRACTTTGSWAVTPSRPGRIGRSCATCCTGAADPPSGVSGTADPQLLHPELEGAAAQAQTLRGVALARHLPTARVEHGADVPPLDLLEGGALRGGGRGKQAGHAERLHGQHAPVRHDHRALDDVLQLADVARP